MTYTVRLHPVIYLPEPGQKCPDCKAMCNLGCIELPRITLVQGPEQTLPGQNLSRINFLKRRSLAGPQEMRSQDMKLIV